MLCKLLRVLRALRGSQIAPAADRFIKRPGLARQRDRRACAEGHFSHRPLEDAWSGSSFSLRLQDLAGAVNGARIEKLIGVFLVPFENRAFRLDESLDLVAGKNPLR